MDWFIEWENNNNDKKEYTESALYTSFSHIGFAVVAVVV